MTNHYYHVTLTPETLFKQRRFDDEISVAVFPARLRTTAIGATTSELEWRSGGVATADGMTANDLVRDSRS